MKVFWVLLSLVVLGAHDIITTKLTYTRDISRVFARRCLACHSSQSAIPLTSYEEVRPWAVGIKEQVLSRRMPPWGAVKGFGHLAPDEGLTQEEMLLIAAWVIGGAPKGDPALLPGIVQAKQPLSAGKDLVDALVVTNRWRLQTPLEVAGIRPLVDAPVTSARIVARFPDGHAEPLLWLFHYDPAWQRTFRFRAPVSLPIGAVIEAGSPIQFALEIQR